MTDKELKRAKQELRESLREMRDAIPEDERAQMSALIEERLIQTVIHAGTVMIFLSFRSEVDTSATAETLLREGHYVAVPWLEGGEITPVAYRFGEELAPGAYGILEPVRHEPIDPAALDAVVAPGLGFDRSGRRIGYGGGYYDRLLRRVRPDVTRAGIAFHQQVIKEVPADRTDQLLDLVVTDEETITCRPGA